MEKAARLARDLCEQSDGMDRGGGRGRWQGVDLRSRVLKTLIESLPRPCWSINMPARHELETKWETRHIFRCIPIECTWPAAQSAQRSSAQESMMVYIHDDFHPLSFLTASYEQGCYIITI